MLAISACVSAPFLTTNVLVAQPLINANRVPGLNTPACSSAATAVANNFKLSRGGNRNQRVIASIPPGARWARYSCMASTV